MSIETFDANDGTFILTMLNDVTARNRAEAELLLRNWAIQASPVGVVITDPQRDDYPVVYVNPAFEAVTGYSAAEAIGQNLRFLHSGDQDQPALDEVRQALAEQRPAHVVLRNYRKDGRLYWNELRIAPIVDASGQLIAYVGIQNDITAQKVAEDELRALYAATSILFQHNNLLDLARQIANSVVEDFNYVDCGLILIDHSRHKLIRMPRSGNYMISPSQELALDGPGLVPEAIRSGQVIYAPDVREHPLYVAVTPDTRSELVIPLRTAQQVIGVLDLQSTQIHAFDDHDLRLLVAYGEHVAAALEIVKLNEELNNRTAELEWRVAQRTSELQRAKDQVETILYNVGDAIVLLSTKGLVLQTNPAFSVCYGYEGDTFYRKSFATERLFVNPEEVAALIEQVANTGISLRQELHSRHQDGHEFVVEAVFAQILTDRNADSQIVCSIHDISGQKDLESGLRAALERERELGELKAQFVSMVSHEFRTPLAVILSSTDILYNYHDRLDTEMRQQKLMNVRSQVNHLTQLTEDVLTLGEANLRGLPYAPTPFDLLACCQEVIDETQAVGLGEHTVRFDHDIDCGETFMDKKLLRHILRNLLSNAMKYSPADAAIEVTLRCAARELHLTVTDHGIGIPESDQKRLFEAFHRAGNVGTISGTGLGLVIVKHAVDAHHGSISFNSVPNAGTTFEITLPVNDAARVFQL